MEKKCKLTISILASNRKDTIPKCLESIKPLLEKVDSELIVTDTGCEEDLLDIIRKYTDKIVRFQWCNDFAAARNVGLNMAHGQWFMYIDDDEWFDDVTEIIKFFNSEEEKDYVLAGFKHSADDKIISDENVKKRFFEIWTAKEAYFKMKGSGITDLKSVNTLKIEKQSFCENGYVFAITEEKTS